MKLSLSAYRAVGPFFAFGEESRRETTRALRAARIGMFPEEYLSVSYIAALSTAWFVAVVTVPALFALGTPWGAALVYGLLSGVLGFAFVRLGFLAYPRFVDGGRARRIDAELPSVVLLCYALAKGGISIVNTFRIVAEEEETYGEISKEYALVLRDITMLGKELTGSLHDVASTTPSANLRDFFEGLVTILNSGADPTAYFKRQVETQETKATLKIEKDIEQAGLMAEMYVSGLLVLPVLLIVILALLSSLGNGGQQVIPLIVYLLIPFGTLTYLVLVEMMLPAATLRIARPRKGELVDFGLDTIPQGMPTLPLPKDVSVRLVAQEMGVDPDGPRGQRKTVRVLFVWARRRLMGAWKAYVARATGNPWDALAITGFVGLLAFGVGAASLLRSHPDRTYLVLDGTAVAFLALIVAIGPVGIFHDRRTRRARRIEKAVPETLGKLAGLNERGITLLRAFDIVGRTETGPLAAELRLVERDVAWNATFGGALTRMRERGTTLAMTKLSLLFERASEATGNLREVLKIVTRDALTTSALLERKRNSMLTYVTVIYGVFAVSLYVLYTTAGLFFGGAELASASGASYAGGKSGLSVGNAKVLFFHTVIIQAACCGFVAGKLGEGHVMSGLKHAAVLVLMGWAIFRFGVLG